MQEVLKGWSKPSIFWAILLIICGFLAIALPFATSWGVVLVIAWLIVFSGVIQFVHAFQSKGVGHILWKLLVAVLYVMIGFYFVIYPAVGVAAFTLALAIFLVIEGVMDLGAFFAERHTSVSGWILFDGILSLTLGLLVWRQWPSSSLWVIGTLVGISMISTGVTRLMLGIAVRRLTHRDMMPVGR